MGFASAVSLAPSFPNPVNERAARVVATGVAALSTLALALQLRWLSLVLAAGFLLRAVAWCAILPLLRAVGFFRAAELDAAGAFAGRILRRRGRAA